MMQNVKKIDVGLDFGSGIRPVGRLAIRDGVIYFQYDDAFILDGVEISPLRLPVEKGLIKLPARPFEGLAGVFSDSLPDGWGRLLMERALRARGILPAQISSLDRLAHVGFHGMGALVYKPDYSSSDLKIDTSLDQLAEQAISVLEGGSQSVIEELLALNGSSAGARPKAMIGVDSKRENISYGTASPADGYEPWLVKFPNARDGPDAGAIEYVYGLMAKDAGVSISEIHLFPAQNGKGFFATQRFDRDRSRRLHIHTVSGLLHSDFRVPALDYADLLTLTGALTKDIREVEKMYRLAVFNVLGHNRDDHGKNFSFLLDETGEWKLSPAYDLTFSGGPGGEQSTMVMGEGKNPGKEHLLKLGLEAKLSRKFMEGVIDQTHQALTEWESLAEQFDVRKSNLRLIGKAIGVSG